MEPFNGQNEKSDMELFMFIILGKGLVLGFQ